MKLSTITNIYITDKIKMEITFPNQGEALYSFYRKNEKGEREEVTSTEAWFEIDRGRNPIVPFIPDLGGGGIPIPIPGRPGIPAF